MVKIFYSSWCNYRQLFLIHYYMKLSQAKLNAKCIIRSVNISNEQTKIRLMELGLIDGCEVKIVKKSILKKTLLIIFCATCFTLKDNLANEIEVEYA